MATTIDLDAFTAAYLECALWASPGLADADGAGPAREYTASDVAPETMSRIMLDCAAFQMENVFEIGARSAQAGHDYWLTRNRAGAGFWDGDWPEAAGAALTEAAHAAGEVDFYIGDDGLLHLGWSDPIGSEPG